MIFMLRTYSIYGRKGWLNNYQIKCSHGETKQQSLLRVLEDLKLGKIGYWHHELGIINETIVRIKLLRTE